ncbi:nucleotidyltransferase domain-containing protein [Candidatus Parcubacteria bacterium]|nr:nucleotidyltransferase domain-containing protein [Candidatus Parcubacteria bacterium]
MLHYLKNGKGEILNILFNSPEKKFFLSEISKTLGRAPGNYKKYIDDFVKEGILLEERKGNMRFFWLNKKYSLYNEIKLIVLKTVGVASDLKKIIDKTRDIKLSFIFGSYATNKFNSNSDIDLLIVGKFDKDKFVNEIILLENKINRDVNYHIYSEDDIIKKLKNDNTFINKIFISSKILLKGNLNEYYEPAKHG